MLRILFTGGGTGGHIYPILAIVEELKKKRPDLDLRYLGVPGVYQNLLEANGIKTSKIISSKLRRYFDVRNFLDAPKFILSLFQALWKVFWSMPDVLFSKGGPGALAIVLACRFYQVPIIIHESDSVPGFTNQISSRFAKRIGISFASAAGILNGQIALVGNPIRTSLLKETTEKDAAKRILGFNSQMPLILVVGGSQGAVRLNDFFMEIFEEIIKDFQIFHQTGHNNYQEVKNELTLASANFSDEEKSRYKLTAYLDKDLKDVLTAADLVVGRAGSGTIFELAAFGKPAILIPLPESAGNHQTVNAYEYAKTGAAIVIEEDNLKPSIFLTQLKKIFSEPERFKSMSEAALKFAKPDAAKVIAEEILRLGD
ncbi:MAG: UDP-N-acetylglucosamine--N-acetylmuramyl-(pentapeptide) pyrophosphoryl-undecaprenol N-acetylglucosamine transferase [Patescibacteria group bacterium]